jgi:pimeloyl-ACP methyl ester carboxylesterase
MKIIYLVLAILALYASSACQNKPTISRIIMLEDLDEKPEKQWRLFNWRYNTHFKTEFIQKNGGKFEYDCPYLRTVKALYQSDTLNLPLIYKACREPIDTFKAPVVIWIHGGPFTYASVENITAKSMLLKNGFTIAEPLYRGSHDRPWNPIKALGKTSSFIDTRNEIIELAKFYHKNNKSVIYAGDSFGGLIISSLLDTTYKNDTVILFAPALSSNPIKNQIKDNKLDLDEPSLDTFQMFCNQTQYKNCKDIEKWSLTNMMLSYSDFSAVKRYRGRKLPSQIYIISGEKDEVVGVNEGKKFAAAFPNSVHHLIVPDLGHNDIGNIRQFNQIEKFLAPVFALNKAKETDK